MKRITQRFGEEFRISNLPQPSDPLQYPQSCVQSNLNQGMYLSKGYGNTSKSDVSSNPLGSSLAPTSLVSAPLASASLPPFNINQTGIGTANFYRNTPPPRIVLGNVTPGVSGPSQALNSSLLNGWNHGNACSSLSAA